MLSGSQNWQETNLGRGGTGYLTTATAAGCGLDYCPNYLEMVPEVASAAPDIVVISGGQNDFNTFTIDSAAVTAAVNATYQATRSALPNARIIAVGPSTPNTASASFMEFDRAVQDAAVSIGAAYISLLEPAVIEAEMVTEDGGHVDNSGHAAIAERVLSALR